MATDQHDCMIRTITEPTFTAPLATTHVASCSCGWEPAKVLGGPWGMPTEDQARQVHTNHARKAARATPQ